MSETNSKPNDDIYKTKVRAIQYFEEVLIPIVKTFTRQTIRGYHGLEHTELVAMRIIDIAINEGYTDFHAELLPLLLAAVLHDSARTDDLYNETHGPDAATRLETQTFLDKSIFRLTDIQKMEIKSAVAKHTNVMPSLFKKRPYILRCLCDADRIRLSWEHGYKSKYFFTKTGRRLASMTPAQTKEYLKNWDQLLKQNKIRNVGRNILSRYQFNNEVRFVEP